MLNSSFLRGIRERLLQKRMINAGVPPITSLHHAKKADSKKTKMQEQKPSKFVSVTLLRDMSKGRCHRFS